MIKDLLKSNASSFVEGYSVLGMISSARAYNDKLKSSGSLVYVPPRNDLYEGDGHLERRKGFSERDIERARLDDHFLGKIEIDSFKTEYPLTNLLSFTTGAFTSLFMLCNSISLITIPIATLFDPNSIHGYEPYAISLFGLASLFVGTNIMSFLYENSRSNRLEEKLSLG